MQAVNVRQLKNNPSQALREAAQDVVLVMNRDQPAALMVGMEQLVGNTDPSAVRLAMALSLFKQRTLSLGAAARLAGRSLPDMLAALAAARIAVVDYPAQELADELATLDSLG